MHHRAGVVCRLCICHGQTKEALPHCAFVGRYRAKPEKGGGSDPFYVTSSACGFSCSTCFKRNCRCNVVCWQQKRDLRDCDAWVFILPEHRPNKDDGGSNVPSEADVKNLTGLSGDEAARRLAEEGPNELPTSKKRSIWAIVLEVVGEPMFMLLVGCGVLYLLLGDTKEAAMLMGFVFVVMGITIYQERKTENALEALRDLSSPRALVIRDGRQLRIPGREVVCGDIFLVSEGDRIPADAVLIWGINLSVNESLLTGESLPVRKVTAEGRPESIML